MSRPHRSLPRRAGLALAGVCVGLLPMSVGVLRTEQLADWPYYGWVLLGVAAYLATPRARTQVLLSVAAFAIALCALDTLARSALQDVVYRRPAERFIERWAPMPQLARFHPDVQFSGSSIGDIAAISDRRATAPVRPTTFVTDRLGFRNDPEWIDQPVDVLLVGDSFGAGIGVAQDEMLSSLLRHDHGVAVYNLAVPFFGPWEELLTLKAAYPELHLAHDAQILWLLFSGNDLDDDFDESLDLQYEPSWLSRARTSYRSFRRRSPVRQLVDRLALRLGLEQPADSARVGRLPNGGEMLYLSSYERSRTRNAEAVRAHPNYAPMRAVFGEMARFAGERGLPVCVVVVPSKEEVYPPDGSPEHADPRPSGFAEVADELADERDFCFVDLKPWLLAAAAEAGYAAEHLLYWDDDTHWSPSGHATVADLLLATGAVRRPSLPEVSAEPPRFRR